MNKYILLKKNKYKKIITIIDGVEVMRNNNPYSDKLITS